MLFKQPNTVIVVGAGHLGANLAGALSGMGFQVSIIDKEENSFRKLPENFSGYQIVGDGTDIDILKSANIVHAEMVIACTNNDNVNSLITQIASRIFGINKVYARLYDTEKEKLIDGFNIQAIYPFKLSINEFERLSSLKLGEGTRA